jgi:hypothetical protein
MWKMAGAKKASFVTWAVRDLPPWARSASLDAAVGGPEHPGAGPVYTPVSDVRPPKPEQAAGRFG